MSETLEAIRKIQSKLYSECDIEIDNFKSEEESDEYFAHTFDVKDKKALFRIAKKTPTKTGWFVTIWKRESDNIIAPYDASDSIDFVVIAVSDNGNIGEFIFPKSILLKQNIFSVNHKGGKRAIRVYSPYCEVKSREAAKTQKWQSQFFVNLTSSKPESILKIKTLFSM